MTKSFTASKSWLFVVASALVLTAQGQTQCATVLQMYKAMGGQTTLRNGCSLAGVLSTNGVVTDIDWKLKGLKFTIPSSIGRLTSLASIDLSENAITGPLPSELFTLSSLTKVNLCNNRFTGSVPSGFGRLTNLQVLGLCYNQFSGSLPVELVNLSNLLTLRLSGNLLSGSIPTFLPRLVKLQHLRLANNQLSGPIPKEIFQLTGLLSLRLNDNQLTGEIPWEIGQLRSLQQLWIYNNQITVIPSSILYLTSGKILFPNPIAQLPQRTFSENPSSVLSSANWTNLLNTPPSLKKRQFSSALNVEELLAMCPLNNVRNADVAAGCVAGIYRKHCLDLTRLGNCQSSYDTVIASSIFKSLGVCAAWKLGLNSMDCRSAITTFNVKLEYITLTSQHASDFARTILGSRTYAPCVASTCKW
jgi:hypothetical protein